MAVIAKTRGSNVQKRLGLFCVLRAKVKFDLLIYDNELYEV
jgi:hypothetical protein